MKTQEMVTAMAAGSAPRLVASTRISFQGTGAPIGGRDRRPGGNVLLAAPLDSLARVLTV